MKESKYLEFRQMESKPKTQVWDVLSKSDKSVLGTIKWYAPWRQYNFFPNLKSNFLTFSSGCMLDIISFMNDLKKVKEETNPK